MTLVLFSQASVDETMRMSWNVIREPHASPQEWKNAHNERGASQTFYKRIL
jgi:hypothetical protein